MATEMTNKYYAIHKLSLQGWSFESNFVFMEILKCFLSSTTPDDAFDPVKIVIDVCISASSSNRSALLQTETDDTDLSISAVRFGVVDLKWAAC